MVIFFIIDNDDHIYGITKDFKISISDAATQQNIIDKIHSQMQQRIKVMQFHQNLLQAQAFKQLLGIHLKESSSSKKLKTFREEFSKAYLDGQPIIWTGQHFITDNYENILNEHLVDQYGSISPYSIADQTQQELTTAKAQSSNPLRQQFNKRYNAFGLHATKTFGLENFDQCIEVTKQTISRYYEAKDAGEDKQISDDYKELSRAAIRQIARHFKCQVEWDKDNYRLEIQNAPKYAKQKSGIHFAAYAPTQKTHLASQPQQKQTRTYAEILTDIASQPETYNLNNFKAGFCTANQFNINAKK